MMYGGIEADMATESDRTGKKQTQLSAFVVAAGIGFVFSIMLVIPYFVSGSGTCNLALDSRINPNTATAASLERLPGIGPKRARAVVAYRQTIGSDGQAFESSPDMEKIKGIGAKTSQKIKPWLCFE
ncbi:MAG: ComEA family DNA-binding protein [Planctomycetota bacterium]|jgi:competence protein ComEA